MARCCAMDKWRYLIEPTILSSPTPMSWDEFLRNPIRWFEGDRSVVVTLDTNMYGKPTRMVWVAAGVLDEVSRLLRQVESSALSDGIDRVAYLGRPGWIRAEGYKVAAVIGIKELGDERTV